MLRRAQHCKQFKQLGARLGLSSVLREGATLLGPLDLEFSRHGPPRTQHWILLPVDSMPRATKQTDPQSPIVTLVASNHLNVLKRNQVTSQITPF